MRVLAVCFLLVLGADEFGRAMSHYRAGRFDDAYGGFLEVSIAEGDDASPELFYDLALAALGAGRFRDAEIAAEKAAVRGGGEYVGLRDFLFGNTAFAQCLSAAELAGRVEAGPVAFDAAILHARSAAGHWQRAALGRADWPAARRNAERALAKLAELVKAREAAAKRRRDRPKPRRPKNPKPKPDPPKPRPDEAPEFRVARAALEDLAPEQVRRLMEKLLQKEKAKIRVRRQARLQGRGAVERDW